MDRKKWLGAGKSQISVSFALEFIQNTFLIIYIINQADAALMYDGAKVLLNTFSRLLRRHPYLIKNNLRKKGMNSVYKIL